MGQPGRAVGFKTLLHRQLREYHDLVNSIDVVNAYTGLLILQYAALPNASAHVQALMQAIVQDQIINKVRTGFNLDTALGAQLDILGTYRGVPREVFGSAPGSYWALVEYADPSPGSYFGIAEYADADPTWNTMQYIDVDSLAYTLTDNQMRRLIKLRAAMESTPFGLADLDNILYSVFGNYVNVVDNENMSIVYQHNHLDPDPDLLWAVTVLAGALPHPAGVSFTVVEV